MKFAHVSFSCKDPLAIERFYTRYFGFTRARVVPIENEQIVFLKSGNVYLELFQAHGESPVPPYVKDGPGYPCLRHIAFQVDDVDAKLKEMGDDAKITLGPMGFDAFISGWRTVWVADPGGNIVEISQGYTDQENPPPLAG
jgi:glyoxylase I family protein